MKTCLGRLLWMLLGVVVGVLLLVGIFVVAPSLGRDEPHFPRTVSPARTGQPDLTLTISEAYLNRKVAEVSRQAGEGAVTDVTVDLKPGERALVSLSTQIEIAGVALNPTVDLDIRVAVVDGALVYRLESIKVGRVPIARALLPGPLKAGVEAAEEEMSRATQDQFNKAHFQPIRVTTTEQSLVLELQETR